MAADARGPLARRRAPGIEGSGDSDRLTELLRQSHIFASVVREMLEVRVLRAATRLPLSVSQFRLLKLMSHDGHHQVGDVAEFLGVSAPAATKCIDKLERLGLVSRSPSEGDRRATWLEVSPRGRRVVRRYDRLKSARLVPALRRFPAADRSRLTDLLERFSLSLLRTGRTGDGACLRCAAYIIESCPVGEIVGGCPYQVTRDERRAAGAARLAPAR